MSVLKFFSAFALISASFRFGIFPIVSRIQCTALASLTFLWLDKRHKHLLRSLCETLLSSSARKSARNKNKIRRLALRMHYRWGGLKRLLFEVALKG